MIKAMLIYPPGNLYQRGEDRSQGNIEDSAATSVRACNDLGYAAATLREQKCDVFLCDYQTSRKGIEDLKNDFTEYLPDLVFLSITNATIFIDLEIVKQLKAQHPKCVFILKGALFYNAPEDLLAHLDLSNVDYLVGGESDFILPKLVAAHFFNEGKIEDINSIFYKKDGAFTPTKFGVWEKDLGILPFPDRALMDNSLYIRPDTGEAQATITTARGCPFSCIYCLTPVISGKKLRSRTPENIVQELQQCYHQFGIRNFFFKSDTFTVDKPWVLDLCKRILQSDLSGKIEWVANSRVAPLDEEVLQAMKSAGCWLVAFGFESGSDDTLTKIKKGTTVEQNLQAARLAKKVGLKVFGFYLIGLPWETKEHVQQTVDLIFKQDADFIEIHLAVPYCGTELYALAQKEQLVSASTLGSDYFNPPIVGTHYLSVGELAEIRRKALLRFHMRPSFILRKLCDAKFSPTILKNYFRFGIRLLKQVISKKH